MECRDAQFYLRLKRHTGAPGGRADELGADVSAALDAHCAGCPACAADARAAAALDRALGAAVTAVPVPAGLRAKLHAAAAAQAAAAWRARAYRGGVLAAAAAVLVALGLGAYSRSRPVVDTDALASAEDQRFHDPEGATQEFLKAQGLPTRLPLPFDYGLHVANGFEQIGGRSVPVVTFRGPTPADRGLAKVYVFAADGRFDLRQLREAQVSGSRVQVVPGEGAARGVTYVILHHGQNLNPFLRGSLPGV